MTAFNRAKAPAPMRPAPENKKILQADILAMNTPATYVPENLRNGIIQYIEHGRSVGSFLTCILDNNLSGSVANAHLTTTAHIASIVRWLWNHAPEQSWGSESKRLGWMDARRRDQLQPVI